MLRKHPNIASQAFGDAPNAVHRIDNWLGDFFRRMKAKAGTRYTVVATVHKIDIIYSKRVRYKEECNPTNRKGYQ